uniref:PL7 alignate lyase n=1 Tax=Saccharina japonica TaxID=88149 RepID=UPI003704D4CC
GAMDPEFLDPQLPPSSNFDLSAWYLSVPTDNNGDGKADSIKENDLNAGYADGTYFYTAADGGMVFRCPIDGYKTSTNTSYTRTELREMLRRGDTSIATQGVNGNNWVFGSAPASAREAAGGVDGVLRATLAVNHVTTTGDSGQVGRVIVGQIHANNDEPLRLYYRKLPGHSKGSVYIAHEPNGGSDSWYDMIGSRSSSASDPSDGIALDEVWSYEVKVVGNTLTVTIFRAGKDDVVQVVDMGNSGYDVADQYQYFKAGVYNQNNTGNASDYVQVTFYALEQSHD